MKGVKIILGFLALMALSYIGMLFIQINRQEIALSFGVFTTEPMPLGFVALTCIFTGMVFVGLLSVYELVGLYITNRSLKKRVEELESQVSAAIAPAVEEPVTPEPAPLPEEVTPPQEEPPPSVPETPSDKT